MQFTWLSRWQPQLLAVLRIMTGLLYLEHATMKFFKFPIPVPGSAYPLPPLAMTAGTIEIVTSVLIIIGMFTRLAAFVASGEMAVAYFMVHVQHGGFWPGVNGGEPAILFCFIYLYLVAAGPGAWSVDGALVRREPIR